MLDQLTTPLFVHRALTQKHTHETSNYRDLVKQLRSGDRDSIMSSLERHIVDAREGSMAPEPEAVEVGSSAG
jgi:hypothetical protein